MATFNIIATLFMVVTEKTRDIGLLRGGSGAAEYTQDIFDPGVLVGLIGASLGVLGGFTICTILQMFRRNCQAKAGFTI